MLQENQNKDADKLSEGQQAYYTYHHKKNALPTTPEIIVNPNYYFAKVAKRQTNCKNSTNCVNPLKSVEEKRIIAE